MFVFSLIPCFWKNPFIAAGLLLVQAESTASVHCGPVPRAFDIFGYLSQRSGTALEMLRDEDMWLPLSRAKESTER